MFSTGPIKSAHVCSVEHTAAPAVPLYDILTYLLYLHCVEIDSGLLFPSYRVSEFFLFFAIMEHLDLHSYHNFPIFSLNYT